MRWHVTLSVMAQKNRNAANDISGFLPAPGAANRCMTGPYLFAVAFLEAISVFCCVSFCVLSPLRILSKVHLYILACLSDHLQKLIFRPISELVDSVARFSHSFRWKLIIYRLFFQIFRLNALWWTHESRKAATLRWRSGNILKIVVHSSCRVLRWLWYRSR